MIKRYEWITEWGGTNYDATPTYNGTWVYYDDHAEAMQKLWQTADTRERMNGQTIATLRAQVTELSDEAYEYAEQLQAAERERDTLRVENDRLRDESHNARQAARGENALRLEAERERDTLRADVERWVKEVAHLKLAAEKAERESAEGAQF